MKRAALLIAAACALARASAAPAADAAEAARAEEPPVLAADAPAGAVLAACRAMLPARPVRLDGRIVKRNRRGTVQAEYRYALEMRRDARPARLAVDVRAKDGAQGLLKATILRDGDGAPTLALADAATGETSSPALDAAVLGTDVTWLDLTLDFLWWPHAGFEAEREGESVHGQKCSVIVVRPGAPVGRVHAVRLWADRKTGCLMQAEQLGADGQALHRLWGTRIKKFDGRWSVSVIETEAPGSGLRTKITVESISDPGKPAAPTA